MNGIQYLLPELIKIVESYLFVSIPISILKLDTNTGEFHFRAGQNAECRLDFKPWISCSKQHFDILSSLPPSIQVHNDLQLIAITMKKEGSKFHWKAFQSIEKLHSRQRAFQRQMERWRDGTLCFYTTSGCFKVQFNLSGCDCSPGRMGFWCFHTEIRDIKTRLDLMTQSMNSVLFTYP